MYGIILAIIWGWLFVNSGVRADGRFVVGRFRGCPGQEQQRCISTLMRLVSIKCRNKCSRPFQLNATRVPGSWVLSSELWVLNQGSWAQRHGTRATTASATIITTQPPLPYIKSFDIPTTHNEYSPPTHWHFSCHGNLFRGCWWAVLFSLDFCCCYSNAQPGRVISNQKASATTNGWSDGGWFRVRITCVLNASICENKLWQMA